MSIFTSPWQAWKYQAAYHLRTLQTRWAGRQTKKPTVVRLLFLGDSRAKAWPQPTATTAGPVWQYFNRGMGFDTSAQTLYRLEKHVLPLKPEVVLLQVGINDFKYMALAQRLLATLVAELVENLTQIVARLTQNGSAVVLSTIFPVCFERWQEEPHDPHLFAEGVAMANERLRQIEARDSVYLFDAAALLAAGPGVPGQWALDGLHLNEEGYRQLDNQLLAVLNAAIDC